MTTIAGVTPKSEESGKSVHGRRRPLSAFIIVGVQGVVAGLLIVTVVICKKQRLK